MTEVEKASPPPKRPILDEARTVEDITGFNQWKARIWVGGPSGSGKTLLLATFPKIFQGVPKPMLLLDYDGRYQTLAGEPGIEVISLFDPDPKSPKAWIKAENIRRELWARARGDFPYSVVVEDGMTQMGKYAMNWALLLNEKRGLGGVPAEHHYMPQMKAFSDHVLSMKELPCHYILNGHLEIIEDKEEGSIKYLPKAIGKSSRTELPGWFDETYYAWRTAGETIKDGPRYFLTTQGSGKMDFCKSSLNTRGKYWNDPVRIDFSKEPKGYSWLIAKRFGLSSLGEMIVQEQGE